MASSRSLTRTLAFLLVVFLASLELVSGRPTDPLFSESEAASPFQKGPAIAPSPAASLSSSHARLFSSHDDVLVANVHQAYRRAPANGYQPLSKRERMILGLGAGIGGSLRKSK